MASKRKTTTAAAAHSVCRISGSGCLLGGAGHLAMPACVCRWANVNDSRHFVAVRQKINKFYPGSGVARSRQDTRACEPTLGRLVFETTCPAQSSSVTQKAVAAPTPLCCNYNPHKKPLL